MGSISKREYARAGRDLADAAGIDRTEGSLNDDNKVTPGVKYRFSEPFRSDFERLLNERERINKAKANGTYKPPAQAQKESPNYYRDKAMEKKPATHAQLGKLRSLGCHDVPTNRLEASRTIDRLLNKK